MCRPERGELTYINSLSIYIPVFYILSYHSLILRENVWLNAVYNIDVILIINIPYFEGHGSANGLPQPRMELAERSHEQTYLG